MKHKVFTIGIFCIYVAAITIFMFVKGLGVTPDRLIPLFILPSLFIRKTRAFLFDWLPLLFILLSYEYLRGLADLTGIPAHYFGQINFDLIIFHTLPIITLQNIFYIPNHLQWYDFVFTFVYFIHFVIPLLFGYILWIDKREHFYEYVTALSILSYSAWITYLLYPSAPPWMASNVGFIPHVTKIMDFTLKAFPQQLNLPTVYQNFDPNPVAAIPSLHAAYPFLYFLFAVRFYGKKGWWLFLYTPLLWFTVVYLGEHYVSDCIIGVLFALAAYLITTKLFHNPKLHLYLRELHWIRLIVKKLASLKKLPAHIFGH